MTDTMIDQLVRPLRAGNDSRPAIDERTPRQDVSMLDVVIPFYECDEEELEYAHNRPLAAKELECVKLSGDVMFRHQIDADLFPCHRMELMCVLLTSFNSTLRVRVTEPESQDTVAEGSAELRYEAGPGLITVKVPLNNRTPPVSSRLDCTISCTPTGVATDSFNIVVQRRGAHNEKMASMRLFRDNLGFSSHMLDRCVKSIKACGLSDDAIQVVAKKQSAAANRNEGFLRTTRPYVCFADDDVEIVNKDTFAILVRTLEETGASVIAPRLVTHTGTIFCADTSFDEQMYPKPRGLGERISGEYRYIKEVPWVPSTFIICRREAVVCADGFDEGYVGSQMEDVDFCLKVRQNDLKCVYAGLVDVVHYNYQRNDHFGMNFDRFRSRWCRYPHLLKALD